MSKVIWDCTDFAFLHSVIGLENLRHLLNQSDAKQLGNLCFPMLEAGYFEFSLAPCDNYLCFD